MAAYSPTAVLVGGFYAERNREYPLEIPVTTLGRARSNTLCIPTPEIAEEHARVLRLENGSGWALEAVSSDARTTLGGEVVPAGERKELAFGDVIGLADREFRFDASADAGVLARLWVVTGVHRGKVFRLEDPEIIVGRSLESTIQFPDRSVSRSHCRLERVDGEWRIEDMESTNGTFVNGSRVREPTPLTSEDEVTLGFSRFRFRGPEEGPIDVRVRETARCN